MELLFFFNFLIRILGTYIRIILNWLIFIKLLIFNYLKDGAILMEIEKTRETSWKIQLKNKNENIELTSVEISGEVRQIKLRLLKNGDFINVEMKKEEFHNFLSLISAFKDVVIGEDKMSFVDDIIREESESYKIMNEPEKDYVKIDHHISEKDYKNNEVKELNPEEWDPW
jgi:hypothetical protein